MKSSIVFFRGLLSWFSNKIHERGVQNWRLNTTWVLTHRGVLILAWEVDGMDAPFFLQHLGESSFKDGGREMDMRSSMGRGRI